MASVKDLSRFRTYETAGLPCLGVFRGTALGLLQGQHAVCNGSRCAAFESAVSLKPEIEGALTARAEFDIHLPMVSVGVVGGNPPSPAGTMVETSSEVPAEKVGVSAGF